MGENKHGKKAATIFMNGKVANIEIPNIAFETLFTVGKYGNSILVTNHKEHKTYVANCNEKETFNLSTGVMLAMARALAGDKPSKLL